MIFIYFILIILLVTVNGFFVASEIVLVSTRKSKIEALISQGSHQAKYLKDDLNNLQSYITVIQLAVTFCSLSIGWIGQAIFHQNGIIAFFAILCLSLLHLTFGELIPKNFVFRISESKRIILIRPLSFFVQLLQPIINVFNKFIEKILRFIGRDEIKQDFYSQEELETILLSNMKRGLLSQEEFYLIRSVKHLKNTAIKNILINKKNIIGFEEKTSLADIKNTILLRKYTYNRYPIYRKTLNKIIGFIYINDILSEKTTNNFVRPILRVNINSKLDKILILMYKNKKFAAVAVDSKNNTHGLIVLSDIINYWLKNLL